MLAVTEAFGSSLRIQNVSRSMASLERSRASCLTSLHSFGRPCGLPDWPFWKGMMLVTTAIANINQWAARASLGKDNGRLGARAALFRHAMGGVACRKRMRDSEPRKQKPRADVSGRGGIVHRIYRAHYADFFDGQRNVALSTADRCIAC